MALRRCYQRQCDDGCDDHGAGIATILRRYCDDTATILATMIGHALRRCSDGLPLVTWSLVLLSGLSHQPRQAPPPSSPEKTHSFSAPLHSRPLPGAEKRHFAIRWLCSTSKLRAQLKDQTLPVSESVISRARAALRESVDAVLLYWRTGGVGKRSYAEISGVTNQ